MSPTPPRSRPGDGTGTEQATGDETTETREPTERARRTRPASPVAVFQAARPPAPAGRDIESPFLDLFGSSPAPVRSGDRTPPARPAEQAPARSSEQANGTHRPNGAARQDASGATRPRRPDGEDPAGRTAAPAGGATDAGRGYDTRRSAETGRPTGGRTTETGRPAGGRTTETGRTAPVEPRHAVQSEDRRTPPAEARRTRPAETRRTPPADRPPPAEQRRAGPPAEQVRSEQRRSGPLEARRVGPPPAAAPAGPVDAAASGPHSAPGSYDAQPSAAPPGRPSGRSEAARRKEARRQDVRAQGGRRKEGRRDGDPRRAADARGAVDTGATDGRGAAEGRGADARGAAEGRGADARGAAEGRGADARGAAETRRTPARPKAPRRVPAIKPPRHKDRDPAVDLAIREIAGHLTFTHSSVTAWYWLPEVRWAFRPDAEREALMSAIAEQYAGLSGLRLHLRRTTRPFPADEWARTIDTYTPRPLAAVPDSPSWSDHLEAAQRHLLSMNHAEGQTYLGVTFARRSLGDTLGERLGRMFGKGTAESERRRLSRMVEQFDEVLGMYGMRGRRVNPGELEWLMYRSVALCMAPPGRLSPVTNGLWERGDLLALTEQVERYRTPYGSTVKLVNRMTGEERHVTVLTVGRMEPLEIPERHEPWLHFHERLPWPMELSSRVDVLGPGDSFRNLEHRLRMIRSQQLDYAEHGMDAPPELERLAQRALHIGDEMTTGLPTDASRVHGWHRIAVGGRTREECLERARRLIQVYSRELRISLQHPKNQDWLAREFIPGEPVANTGYVRRMPVNLFAAALPQAASTVGDRRGDLIGRTAGTSRRPVFLDLHFPMEVRERSGLAVFVAEPGGGKSTLMGGLGYLAARRGVQVTLLDPSGPLARLAQMPELKPYSRVLNLTGSEHGTLAPYSLIPTPLRSEFAAGPSGEREYEIAVSNARAERRMLVQDICSMLVPPQVAREASTATLLRHAARQVPAEETATLDDIVKCLSDMTDPEAREVANLLMDTAEMPLAMLFFGKPPEGMLGSDDTLTVITMAGLRLPDLKIEREYWSAEEALALPMLHTAHRLAVRRCYGGEMTSRKLVGLDEAHFMEGWRSGRSFLVRLARDSRKWNLAALVASQNPKDILGLDVQNLVSTVFVGRIAEDPEIAAEALRMLRVPTGVGYEVTLASLSQVDATSSDRLGFREFVMRDVDGRVQKIRVDLSYVQNLLNQLDTTPAAGPAPVIARADESEA